MSMMIARAPYKDVLAALERTIDVEGLRTVMVSPKHRSIELQKGVNFFTLGDDIKVHVVDLEPLVVVNIEARNREGTRVLKVGWDYHWKQEQRFLRTLRHILGAKRCHIMD